MSNNCSIISGVPHGTKTDVNFRGYTIPKDAIVFANFNAVNMDGHLWEEPEKFSPERFLEKQENNALTVVKTEYFIPFSIGE